jgi:Na+/H+-dicarboxylate symporter
MGMEGKVMADERRIGLLGWILIGFVVGIVFGVLFKDLSLSLSWIGDLFLRLLKMLIVPLVFFCCHRRRLHRDPPGPRG